jgi:hypothetical protein
MGSREPQGRRRRSQQARRRQYTRQSGVGGPGRWAVSRRFFQKGIAQHLVHAPYSGQTFSQLGITPKRFRQLG